MSHCSCCVVHFFFFNDTATTEIYTLSLHDALPIYLRPVPARRVRDRADACHGGDRTSSGEGGARPAAAPAVDRGHGDGDRKSTRLNSSHLVISYAVFFLKKKKMVAVM